MSKSMTPQSNLQLEIGHVLLIDIVGYSKLLIDEQREALGTLNRLVRETDCFRGAAPDRAPLCLPTGDGVVLVFTTSPDAPVRCAVQIARALARLPAPIPVRMGIHSGPVSSVSDFNDRPNFAGAGINIAQRVMDCGDAGHILLSERVASDLGQFREWQGRLHDLGTAEVKHGVTVHLYNLYGEDFGNRAVPAKLQPVPARTAPPAAQRKRFAFVSAGLIGLAIIAGIFIYGGRNAPTPEAEKSIAVLPFADLSATKDQEYFCDGISEELLDRLAKTPGLRVVARTSSFSFKGKAVAVSEIAQKLGVQHLLEGSVRRDGNRIRVTAQLINARDGLHLWSDSYERELASIFKLQDEITGAIADALKLKLVGAARAKGEANTDAYDLYLQGIFFSNKGSEEALRKSLELFNACLEKDPNSARAWAGIAKAWTWLADAYVRPREAYPIVKQAALKAVELDETNPDAHVYLSEAERVLDWDLAASNAELRRALELDPNSGTAHFFSAFNRSVEGEREAALNHMRHALKADPLSPLISNFAALAFACEGLFDEAIKEAKRTLELDPNFLYHSPALADAYRHKKGMFQEAIDVYRKAEQVTGRPQARLALAYVATGREPEAREILQSVIELSRTRYLPPEEIAAIYAALRDNDEAIRWLERACEEHSGPLHVIAFSPDFRPLYADPRFADILRKIGADPAKVFRAGARTSSTG